MKHDTEDTRADRVGPVRITFTNNQLTAWAGACAVVGKFLERIGFRERVPAHLPVEERSPNGSWSTVGWVKRHWGHLEEEKEPHIVALRLTACVQNAIHGIENWREMDRRVEVADALVARRTRKQARRVVRMRHLEVPAVSVIYVNATRQPALRLGVRDRSLHAKIRHWLQQIRRLNVRVFNGDWVAVPTTT